MELLLACDIMTALCVGAFAAAWIIAGFDTTPRTPSDWYRFY